MCEFRQCTLFLVAKTWKIVVLASCGKAGRGRKVWPLVPKKQVFIRKGKVSTALLRKTSNISTDMSDVKFELQVA